MPTNAGTFIGNKNKRVVQLHLLIKHIQRYG